MPDRPRDHARVLEADVDPPAGLAVRRDEPTRHSAGVVQETVPVSATKPAPGTVDVVEEVVSVTRPRRIGSAVRIIFGLIWAVDAYFKWQPSFVQHLQDVISGGAQGQPSFFAPWFNFAKGVVAVNPTLWAYGIAIAEAGIALALILGLARKVTYVGGVIYSLLIWATAEGLGRTAGIATDIGTAIIYTVVFLALLALDVRGKGTRPHSLDAMIERRVPAWRRLAEVRK